MAGERILFLGPRDSPLIEWLRRQGEEVVQTSGKLSARALERRGFTFLVSYGYRHLVRKEVLDLFPGRAINLHISYLPWNRGADPNLWSFVDDTPKGVTIHLMDEGIDTGDILVQKEVEVETEGATLATTYGLLQEEIRRLFERSWASIRGGECPPKPQIGPGTVHRTRDRDALVPLLVEGWETPIAVLEGRLARIGEAASDPPADG